MKSLKPFVLLCFLSVSIAGCNSELKPVPTPIVTTEPIPDLIEEKHEFLYENPADENGDIYSDPYRVQLATPEQDQATIDSFEIIEN